MNEAASLTSTVVDAPVVPSGGGACRVSLRVACEVPEGARVRRRPVDVALVVQRPADGDAAASEATDAVVDAVHTVLHKGDRVTIVTFGDGSVDVNPRWWRPGRLGRHEPTARGGGPTLLHQAWVEGADTVATVAAPRVPVVLVVATGHADAGVVDVATLASDVGALAAAGISTSVVGVGRDLHVERLEAMARAGGGTCSIVQSSDDVRTDVLKVALGLRAHRCLAVRARFEPSEGIEWVGVEPGPVWEEGTVRLPDVYAGRPVEVHVDLVAAPGAAGGGVDVGRWTVAWVDDDGEDREHQTTVRAAVERTTRSAAPPRSAMPYDVVDQVMPAQRGGGSYLLRLVRGDVTTVEAGALLNPSNAWLHGAGQSVDGAVHRRGGIELTRACREIGRVDVGQSVVTPGFALPVDFVVHTAVPVFETDVGSWRQLSSCYRTGLALASTMRVTHMSVPILGIGTNGFPVEEGVCLAFEEIHRFQTMVGGLDVVSVVVLDEEIVSHAVAALHGLSATHQRSRSLWSLG